MKKIYFILAFIVLSFLSYKFLDYESVSMKEYVLSEKTNKVNLEYKMIYNSYSNVSKLVFDTKINTKKVLELFAKRDRGALYEYLKDNYKKITKFSVKQLHFHLPNNDSFLRMHRPEKYGDNLSKDRLTVKYVSQNQKYIDGFEEGKIFNGFRFVYPLFEDDKYIGSVEISFSALFFIQEIVRGYDVHVDFFIDEDVVKQKVFKDEISNYVASPIKGYMFEKSIVNYTGEADTNTESLKRYETLITTRFKIKKAFSIYLKEKHIISTFIPLINPLNKKCVAWLKVDAKNSVISVIEKTKNSIFIIVIILILFMLLYIYKHLKFEESLKREVKKKTKELNSINNHLEELVEKEVEKNKEQEKILIVQSQYAAIGNMISMIAHQWRQPISIIAMEVNNIILDIELDDLNSDILKECSENILLTTEELSHTIDEFGDFFKPNNAPEDISIQDLLANVIKIIGKSLENNNIELSIDLKENILLTTYTKELMQVLMNILHNAKELFIQQTQDEKRISIVIVDKDNDVEIVICDNAGGIPEESMDQIFYPYFSTKNEQNGSGLGLYITKTIVEKHLMGKIEVENKFNGACFKISFPKII